MGTGRVVRHDWKYRVDGEIGRFEFATYRLEQGGKEVYRSVGDLFPELHVGEWYLTRGFKEVGLVAGSGEQSYRKTAWWLNRMRHQAGGTPARTLQEQTEAEGRRVQAEVARLGAEVLARHGFDEVESGCWGPTSVPLMAPAEVAAAIEMNGADAAARAEMRSNPVGYECPAASVRLSVDDVGVKRQKAQRGETLLPDPAETKFLHTTVIHLQTETGSAVVSGMGMIAVLRLAAAFLLATGLLRRSLVFFVDGQKALHANLATVFARWQGVQVILDWHHLRQKCSQALSLALNGKDRRNRVLAQLTALLWDGRTAAAHDFLAQLNPAWVKNPDQLEKLRASLIRNTPYIPCYSVRKALGLRNSSNLGEKYNDLVVSQRQKHNGMSWSAHGSQALAALATLKLNQQVQSWFKTGQIQFKLTP